MSSGLLDTRRVRVAFGAVLLGTATLLLATSYSSGSADAVQPPSLQHLGYSSSSSAKPKPQPTRTVTKTVTAHPTATVTRTGPTRTVTRTVTPCPKTVTKTVAGPTRTVTETAPGKTETSTVTQTETDTQTFNYTTTVTKTETETYTPPDLNTTTVAKEVALNVQDGSSSSLDVPRVVLAGLFALFAVPFLLPRRRRNRGH